MCNHFAKYKPLLQTFSLQEQIHVIYAMIKKLVNIKAYSKHKR